MSAKRPYGKPVKLLADFQGYPDGRLVRFEVRRKKVQGEEKVEELYGSTNSGKAVAFWNPNFGERTVILQENPVTERIEEKYYFVAKIDDKEKKSGEFEFLYPLTVHVDTDGEPLDGVKFTITFSDESKREAKFIKGTAEFNEVPLGKFKIEIDGYSPGTLYGVVKRS